MMQLVQQLSSGLEVWLAFEGYIKHVAASFLEAIT